MPLYLATAGVPVFAGLVLIGIFSLHADAVEEGAAADGIGIRVTGRAGVTSDIALNG